MRDFPFPAFLSEWQRWFAEIMVSPIQESDSANIPVYSFALIQEISKKITPSPTLRSEERMGIYQQQYWWRLLSVMQEIFPSLVAIFDYEDFNRLIAEPYLSEHPPIDWFISHIGSELPRWLNRNYRKKNAPLLIQLAKLDLAYEALLFAEILPKIDLSDIAQCEVKTLFLQPFVLLFELDPNLFVFREQLLKHPPAHWQRFPLPEYKKVNEKRFSVLYRNQERNYYEEISPSFFSLLSRFQKGAKLEDLISLLENYQEIIPSFQSMASKGWLTFFPLINSVQLLNDDSLSFEQPSAEIRNRPFLGAS